MEELCVWWEKTNLYGNCLCLCCTWGRQASSPYQRPSDVSETLNQSLTLSLSRLALLWGCGQKPLHANTWRWCLYVTDVACTELSSGSWTNRNLPREQVRTVSTELTERAYAYIQHAYICACFVSLLSRRVTTWFAAVTSSNLGPYWGCSE